MKGLERRTSEALHRVADGLPVSEEDMDRMEGELMTLLETRPSEVQVARRGRWEWSVAAAAVAALVLGGAALWQVNHERTAPAAPAPAPITSPLVQPELVGLWQNQPDSSWLWEITADGRVRSTETAVAYLRGADDPTSEDAGVTIIKRQGDLYTLAETNPPRRDGDCDTLRIHLVSPGAATLTDGCPPSGEQMLLHLERVSPRNAGSSALAPRFPTEVARQVTVPAQLEGAWLNEVTKQLLVVGQLSPDEPLTYLVDDDGDGSLRPDLRGRLNVSTDGSVRPLPGSSVGGGCAPVFAKVVSNTATLVTTSSAGGCFPAGTTQTWLRLN